MNYQKVSIDKLKPDPNQPRRHIDQKALEELAVSIKNEGIVNAIEVDENFIIITGERRWRASKLAGLEEVPVKIITIVDDKKKFVRQVQENIHNNTMSPLDTALALDKIRRAMFCENGETPYGYGVSELQKLFGLPRRTVSDLLDLLGTQGELREALKDPKFSRTKVVSIKETPEKYRLQIEDLVARQKTITRDTVRQIVYALQRADRYEEYDNAKKLLAQNYEGLTTVEALAKISKIVPTEESRLKEPSDATRNITKKIMELTELLEDYPLVSFDDFHRPFTVRDVSALGFYLQNYLQGKGIEEMKVKKLQS